jgi:UDP-N-acetylmuramate dehydrogenase
MTIQENISLLPYNTFRIDVKAAVVAEYESVRELAAILRRYKDMPVLPVGEGSNLLFTCDFDGVILHSRMQGARAVKETRDEVCIEAEAGLRLDDLVAQLADMDIRGMENLSHIPGTVGAAAVQNVGAYGIEAKDVIEKVHVLDRMTLRAHAYNNEECAFAYRDSRFKHDWRDRYIVTSVVFRLSKEGPFRLDYGGLRQALADRDLQSLTALDVRRAVIDIRRSKLPEVSETGSAGSFFKNPVVSSDMFAGIKAQYKEVPFFPTEGGVKIPAAWLIEQCGLKGRSVGGAQVYERQPLVIVNTGGATPADITALAQQVIDAVQSRFSITLTPEVIYI